MLRKETGLQLTIHRFPAILSITLLTIVWGSCQNSRLPGCDRIIQNIYDDPRIQRNDKSLNAIVQKYLELNPECLGLHFLYGDLLIDQDSLKKAEEIFRRSLRLDKSFIYANYKLGVINYLGDRNDIAIQFYELALSSKQKVGNYYFESYMEDSERQFDIPVTELAFQIGLASYSNRDLEKAKVHFQYCLLQKYNLRESNYYLGIILAEQNRHSESCNYFRKAIIFGESRASEFLKKYCP